jgi:hypothetical protein
MSEALNPAASLSTFSVATWNVNSIAAHERQVLYRKPNAVLPVFRRRVFVSLVMKSSALVMAEVTVLASPHSNHSATLNSACPAPMPRLMNRVSWPQRLKEFASCVPTPQMVAKLVLIRTGSNWPGSPC